MRQSRLVAEGEVVHVSSSSVSSYFLVGLTVQIWARDPVGTYEIRGILRILVIIIYLVDNFKCHCDSTYCSTTNSTCTKYACEPATDIFGSMTRRARPKNANACGFRFYATPSWFRTASWASQRSSHRSRRTQACEDPLATHFSGPLLPTLRSSPDFSRWSAVHQMTPNLTRSGEALSSAL